MHARQSPVENNNGRQGDSGNKSKDFRTCIM